MGEKAKIKKQLILGKAREVFVEKGYKRTTMKDIVEKSEISRGGLYLYYENPAQIFLDVLKSDSAVGEDSFEEEIPEDATAADILLMFLQEEKKEILRKKDSLVQATYEYYFENKPPKRDNILKRDFETAVAMLEKLIASGVRSKEFVCKTPAEAARSIMYTLEGLRISAQTIGITGDAIDRQIYYILLSLGVSEK